MGVARDDLEVVLDPAGVLADVSRSVIRRVIDAEGVTLNGKVANGGPQKLAKGTKIDKAYLQSIEKYHWFDIRPADDDVASQLESIKNSIERQRHSFDLAFEEKRKKLTQGDELPAGVLKMVKVYLAVKRRLQPGDKMAGRHGNKGVVSKVVPVEDMPYMADGTPCDEVYSAEEFPFGATTYKPRFRSISMQANNPHLRDICAQNYIEINADDAAGADLAVLVGTVGNFDLSAGDFIF